MGQGEDRINLCGQDPHVWDLTLGTMGSSGPAIALEGEMLMGSVNVDETENAFRTKQKLDSNSVISKFRVKPMGASRLLIPPFRVVQMPKVRPVLHLDVRRLESEFVHGYREGDRVFYVSITNDSSATQLVTTQIKQSWDSH